eukprot:CAMPEP_0182529518 /NCGR_PEP_ID=MMETSP1323-20130603/5250_1 /TAXON_ID=236787 /ORGANISM="Florenciella parvula, Strain RCC1693" /LENGTH=79 /DNA_ID=CAMNT_0024738727 /DNA_START=53 /DNA_END=289 /DNA_ORIENTATION=-
MAYREERIGEDFTLEQHGAEPCSRGDTELGRGAGSRGWVEGLSRRGCSGRGGCTCAFVAGGGGEMRAGGARRGGSLPLG